MDSFMQLVKRFELDVQSMAICRDADVRLHIDSKVEELRHTIILFHQLRNRRTTISKLPGELLGLVFYHIRDIVASESGAARLSWIHCVSHVCSLWRELALSMPCLWASISVTSVGHRWLPEMVRRSCPTNLSISANYDGYNFVHNMQSVLEEDVLHRLDALELTNVDSACLHAIFPSPLSSEADADNSRFKFPRRFSSLRKLAISTTARGRLSDPFILCDASLDAPCLQQLELTKCAVQWDAKFFSRLTHLTINNPTVIPSSSSSTLLHALLAASETLTSLSLVRSLAAILASRKLFLDSDVPAPTLINLPLLQNLCINESLANVDQIISFIGIISTTPKTTIQIAISSTEDQRGKEYWHNDFSRIIARIPEFLCRSRWTALFEGIHRDNTAFTGHWPPISLSKGEMADIKALSLGYSTSWQRSKFELGLASSLNTTVQPGPLGSSDNFPLDFSLSFEWVKPRATVHGATCDTSTLLAMQAFDAFDLASLRRLRCQGINMPTEAWRRVLCSLGMLEEIQFFHLPGGENNFFSGSLASRGVKLSQNVEQFSRALHWGDSEQQEIYQNIGSPIHLFRREYHSYGFLQPAPALQVVVLQPQDSSENCTILQEALGRRAKAGVPQFRVLIWETTYHLF